MMNPDLSIPTNLPDFSGLDLDFNIIDAHHHLFDLEQIYYPWLTDAPEAHFLLGDYDSLKRNYSCDDYRTDTKKLKVVKTVHVEAESDHQDPLRGNRMVEYGDETRRNTECNRGPFVAASSGFRKYP